MRLSTDLTVFAGSEPLEETGIARAVLSVNRKQIEARLAELKGEASTIRQRAHALRHHILWLYDANACEKMGYGQDWEKLLEEFTGLDIPIKTFYWMMRWAEGEDILSANGKPAQLTAADVRVALKYTKIYGPELVADAHRSVEQMRNDPGSRISLDKTYDSNLSKSIELTLSALPAADPRRKLIGSASPKKQEKKQADSTTPAEPAGAAAAPEVDPVTVGRGVPPKPMALPVTTDSEEPEAMPSETHQAEETREEHVPDVQQIDFPAFEEALKTALTWAENQNIDGDLQVRLQVSSVLCEVAGWIEWST
jgi:hypothetical protein